MTLLAWGVFLALNEAFEPTAATHRLEHKRYPNQVFGFLIGLLPLAPMRTFGYLNWCCTDICESTKSENLKIFDRKEIVKPLLALTLFISLFNSSSNAFAQKQSCDEADRIAFVFTKAGVAGDIDAAWNLMDHSSPKWKTKEKFKLELDRQFRPMTGKPYVRVLLDREYGAAKCALDLDRIRKLRTSRLLVHLDPERLGNRMAEVLPITLEIRYVEKTGWRVFRFDSTAM